MQNSNSKTVSADDLHPNVIPFISTKSRDLHSTNDPTFQPHISTHYPNIRFNTSSSVSFNSSSTFKSITANATLTHLNHTVQEGFLVWSPSCQIPAANPLGKDVMKLFRKGEYSDLTE